MSTIFSLVAAVCLCVSFDGREDLDEDEENYAIEWNL